MRVALREGWHFGTVREGGEGTWKGGFLKGGAATDTTEGLAGKRKASL